MGPLDTHTFPAVPSNLSRLSDGHYGHGKLGLGCLYGGPGHGAGKGGEKFE